jgi:hypothetical protein
MLNIYYTDTVVWVKDNGSDQWGEPETATETSIRAHVQWGTRYIKNAVGELISAVATVYMKDEPSHKDKLRFEGADHIILQISKQRTFSKDSHYEVIVQ